MSVELISWAFKQPIAHSSAKFVLVVMADAANNEGCCAFVSVAYIAEASGQDRKTVLANMRRLQDLGYISDTGKRIGKTGQVIVYRLNKGLNDTENGTFKESQNRNSTENGTVPVLDGNSTVFPAKESRFSREESQKRDTEPFLTDKSNRKSNRKEAPAVAVDLPDWLPVDVWTDWVEHRKSIRKPMTQKAAELSIGQLADLRAQGFAPKAVIENAIVCGWQGLYAPKVQQQRGGQPNGQGGNRQQQLEERNRAAADEWLNSRNSHA